MLARASSAMGKVMRAVFSFCTAFFTGCGQAHPLGALSQGVSTGWNVGTTGGCGIGFDLQREAGHTVFPYVGKGNRLVGLVSSWKVSL